MNLDKEWAFRKNSIARENIGEHDADNRFMGYGIHRQLTEWQEDHPGCTPIGICYDKAEEKYGCFPMVYEDQDGNRFYTHCDIKTVEEYIGLDL